MKLLRRREVITSWAHCGLHLALIFMILEAIHVGKLCGGKYSPEFLTSCYCGLLIAAIPSFFLLTFRSKWTWLLTSAVLFLYAGFAVPEGIEDLYQILFHGLLGASGPSLSLFIRLVFTLFLFVPFAGFLLLALEDIRELFKRRSLVEGTGTFSKRS